MEEREIIRLTTTDKTRNSLRSSIFKMRSRPFFSTVSGKFQVGLRDIVAWKTPWKNLDSESTTGIRHLVPT